MNTRPCCQTCGRPLTVADRIVAFLRSVRPLGTDAASANEIAHGLRVRAPSVRAALRKLERGRRVRAISLRVVGQGGRRFLVGYKSR